MKNSVILIGAGEIGGVFARGLLKTGHPVFPVTRKIKLTDVYKEVSDPKAVIVSVGEKDIDDVLKNIPNELHNKLVLVQNELLPKDWEKYNIENPTVISIWFEKKYPNDYKVIIPSPVYGAKAGLVSESLGALNISTKIIESYDDLIKELVIKNLYILTVNIAGLKVGGTVGELWKNYRQLAEDIASDVLDIQFRLIGKELDRRMLVDGMVEAFKGDLNHKCMGRSAPARLERAIKLADALYLDIKTLRGVNS